jgi:hypothetical protein
MRLLLEIMSWPGFDGPIHWPIMTDCAVAVWQRTDAHNRAAHYGATDTHCCNAALEKRAHDLIFDVRFLGAFLSKGFP